MRDYSLNISAFYVAPSDQTRTIVMAQTKSELIIKNYILHFSGTVEGVARSVV